GSHFLITQHLHNSTIPELSLASLSALGPSVDYDAISGCQPDSSFSDSFDLGDARCDVRTTGGLHESCADLTNLRGKDVSKSPHVISKDRPLESSGAGRNPFLNDVGGVTVRSEPLQASLCWCHVVVILRVRKMLEIYPDCTRTCLPIGQQLSSPKDLPLLLLSPFEV